MTIRALIAALATSTLLTVAGCASSATTGNAPAPAGSSAPAGGAGAQGANTRPVTKDVCAALPAATATQITGTTFTATKSRSVEGLVFSCEYSGPNGALLQISFVTQNGRQDFDTDITALKAVKHPPNRISGVGDEAFSEPDPHGNAGSIGASAFASYGAVFGDTCIKVGGLTYVTAAQGKQIVERLHGSL